MSRLASTLVGPLLIATAALALPVCDNVNPKLSCGASYTNEDACSAAGCCWDTNEGVVHPCFAPAISGYLYTELQNTPGVRSGTLSLTQESGIFGGGDFTTLDMTITQETTSRTHIKIVPQGSTQWEIPESLIPRPGGVYDGPDAVTRVQISEPTTPLEIVISRADSSTATEENIFIFSKDMVFQEQYLQYVLGVPSDTVTTFGFGESTRVTQHMTPGSTNTLWNSDYLAANFDVSLYGSHPFFVQVSESGKAHGVLFMNSNGMDAYLQGDGTGKEQGESLGVQSTGGVFDLYLFAGPSPQDVVAQYLEVIGMPAMMPYWSLGFHNCRYGYPSVAYVEQVVANYSAAGIPLETQWMDIDYMDKYLDFTLDPVLFSPTDMTSFLTELHNDHQKFIPIVDPGIYMRNNSYPTLVSGLQQDVFVKDLNGVDPYLGQVWPGPTYYPDWFAANTASWWADELVQFHDLAAYDGLWIDMNEISNFCNVDGKGQVCSLDPTGVTCDGSTTCCLVCTTPDPTNTLDFPPYTPHVAQGALSTKTFAMSAIHAGGVREYDAHNLYGFMESVATQAALVAATGKRPFMVTRSTFAGSGKYAAHWTGDNVASWNDLAASITTMNNMALFGIPMVGADICGFLEDTTPELCTRWIQVGAFSPFARNHNGLYDAPQELYRWDSVADASRSVLNLRYRLLPYLYTLLYKAHKKGETVMNAMWMHFPTDRTAFFRDGQYMWSSGLLFTPVLVQGADKVEGYFPQGKWFSLFDNSLIDASAGGVLQMLPTPLMDTNVHARGGTVLPMQQFKMTTFEAKTTPVTLLVALDVEGKATGSLFMDDGEQVEITSYSEVSYTVTTETEGTILLTSTVLSALYECPTCILGTVKVMGVTGTTCSASLQPAAGGAAIQPAVISLTLASSTLFYSSVSITFDEATAVNIFTNHIVQIMCTATTPHSEDNDDGFSSLPSYAQGLIITTCVVFGIAILFVASKVMKFQNKPFSQSYFSGGEEGQSRVSDPLLVLDDDEC